jgi:hypothetical protein
MIIAPETLRARWKVNLEMRGCIFIFFDSLSRQSASQSSIKSFVYKINRVEIQLRVRIIILQLGAWQGA